MMGATFQKVAPVAGALGYSVEDVSLAIGLMANASIKSEVAGTSLKTALANMAKPTKQMKEYMDKYGISLTNADGSMKSFREVVDNLRSSLGGLSETEQVAAATAIFGKESFAGMLAIVNASEADFQKLSDSVNNSAGAAERMAQIKLDNFQGRVTLLQSGRGKGRGADLQTDRVYQCKPGVGADDHKGCHRTSGVQGGGAGGKTGVP